MIKSHIDALQIIIRSDTIRKAIGEIFNETLAESLPEVSGESDEVVGQKYRAYATARQLIEDAFYKLDSYKEFEGGSSSNNRHI